MSEICSRRLYGGLGLPEEEGESMELLSAPAGRFPAASFRRRRAGGGAFRCAIAEPSGVPAPLGQKTQYRDGWFAKVFMGLFARKMEKFASGGTTSSKGIGDWDYESFVDVSRRVMMGRSRKQQQEAVREVLLSMLPPGAPAQVRRLSPPRRNHRRRCPYSAAWPINRISCSLQFRKLFPPTRWAAEFNAALTVPFFYWLVGPSEVSPNLLPINFFQALLVLDWNLSC